MKLDQRSQEKDLKACHNIIEGIIKENALKSLLEASNVKFEDQVRGEFDYKDIKLVARTDFHFEDYILKKVYKFHSRVKEENEGKNN